MIGKTLAQYEILDLLGQGGMGSVYRARDSRLGREVAIKLVPDALAREATHLARFEREARLLASINHPGIATLFGLDEHEGTRFLSMELVEGGTLTDLLDRGPIPLERILALACEIATALEAAHARGIIHRDLKPSNIGLSAEGNVKLLDFGLARETPGTIASADALTVTSALTQEGAILGTPTYMSPEQVRGENADHRSDIWSFGVVLFEMLTGRRPFEGGSLADTFSLILSSDPDFEELPASVPFAVRRLIRRCLVKDASMRLQSIGDARVELREILDGASAAHGSSSEGHAAAGAGSGSAWGTGSSQGSHSAQGTRPRALLWMLLALIPVAALATWYAKPESPLPGAVATSSGVGRFEIAAPEGKLLFHRYQRGVALSPDGQTLAFVAGTTEHPMASHSGETAIYVRRLDNWESFQVPGTENASQPVWSPDGEWLAFDQGGELRRARVSGGHAETVIDRHSHWGVDWAEDDWIYFNFSSRIGRVRPTGGDVDTLVHFDREAGLTGSILPHALPEGRGMLFTDRDLYTSLDYEQSARVSVLSLPAREVKELIPGATDARYLESGHLIYAKEAALYAVPFDLDRLEVTGNEVKVLDQVIHSIHAGGFAREVAAAQFDVSLDGTLVYLEGSVFPMRPREVVWIDREGRVDPLPLEDKQWLGAKLSPDGRRVLLSTNYPPRDVWTYDLERGSLQRQTFEGQTHLAVWGPGPDQFTVPAHREGRLRVLTKQLGTGPGEVTEIPVEGEHWVSGWGPAGRTLLSRQWGNLWRIDPEGNSEVLFETSFTESCPQISPDGKWLLYNANPSEVEMLYLRRWPDGERAQPVAPGEAYQGIWSHDGSEIFYWSYMDENGEETDQGFLMAVAVEEVGDELKLGPPRKLFEADVMLVGRQVNYDVADDGRILAVLEDAVVQDQRIIEAMFPDRIRVVTGWVGELKDKFGQQ